MGELTTPGNQTPAMPVRSDPTTPALPLDLMREMLDNQKQELALRVQELELEKQQDVHAFTYSQEALKIKAQDQREIRGHQLSMRKTAFWLVGVILVVVVGLIVYALWRDKDIFAMEVLKAVVFILTGGAGGYGLAKSQRPSSSNAPAPSGPPSRRP